MIEIDMAPSCMDLYEDIRNKFDQIGKNNPIIGAYYKHDPTIEYHWANCIVEFEVRLKDFCRLEINLTKPYNMTKVPQKIDRILEDVAYKCIKLDD